MSLSIILNYYQDLILIDSTSTIGYMLVNSYSTINLFNTTSLNLNLTYVYTYPFIYIFILITVLAIIICLAYNTDELLIFTSYCILILMAGYTIFYTDSLLIFFLAYELLLVPSFFILYKFAKTRRCVEAAYLMFFYTQFGALFLIFILLYIILITQTYLFSTVSLFYFTPSEVNFIFLCAFTGFGVKLPV